MTIPQAPSLPLLLKQILAVLRAQLTSVDTNYWNWLAFFLLISVGSTYVLCMPNFILETEAIVSKYMNYHHPLHEIFDDLYFPSTRGIAVLSYTQIMIIRKYCIQIIIHCARVFVVYRLTTMFQLWENWN